MFQGYVSTQLSPIESIQADYHDIDKNKSILKQFFSGKRAKPIETIKLILQLDTLAAKDTQLIRCVLNREIRKNRENPNKALLETQDEVLKNMLMTANLDMWSPNSWECSSDVRLELPKDNSTYQETVRKEIKRDFDHRGSIIIGDKLYEGKPEDVKSKLKEEVKNACSANLKDERIDAFVERAMIMSTQHVINDAVEKYIQYAKNTPSMKSCNELENPVCPKKMLSPDLDIPMVVKFSIDKEGVTAQAQKVFEYVEGSKNTNSSSSRKEIVFTATANMKFAEYLEDDNEFLNPKKITADVKVNIDTENIHGFIDKKKEQARVAAIAKKKEQDKVAGIAKQQEQDKVAVLTEEGKLIYLSEDAVLSDSDTKPIGSGYVGEPIESDQADPRAEAEVIDPETEAAEGAEVIDSETEAADPETEAADSEAKAADTAAGTAEPEAEAVAPETSKSSVSKTAKKHPIESEEENQTKKQENNNSVYTNRKRDLESELRELEKKYQEIDQEISQSSEHYVGGDEYYTSLKEKYEKEHKELQNNIDSIKIKLKDNEGDMFLVIEKTLKRFVADKVKDEIKGEVDEEGLNRAMTKLEEKIEYEMQSGTENELTDGVKMYYEEDINNEVNGHLIAERNGLEIELEEQEKRIRSVEAKTKKMFKSMTDSIDEEADHYNALVSKKAELFAEIIALKARQRGYK